MNLFQTLLSTIQKAFIQAGYDISDITDTNLLKKSDRPDLSDFQSNAPMILAKTNKTSPRIIAEKVVTLLRDNGSLDQITIDGPGFINFTVNDNLLCKKTNELFENNRFGHDKTQYSLTTVIDYGGPNIAKPLHVGHLRSLIVGDAIKKICEFSGDKVIGDIHLGDWGRPIGLLIAYIEELYPNLPYFTPEDQYVSDPSFTPDISVQDLAKFYPLSSMKAQDDKDFMEKAKKYTLKLQNGHKGYLDLWKYFIDVSIADLKISLKKLNIAFDLWNGESTVNDRVREMIIRFKENGIITESDGALIINLDENSDSQNKSMPPLIMEKSDGAILYSSTDMATIEDRVQNLGADIILYVVDARQSLHFSQLFKAAEISDIKKSSQLEHIKFGTVNGNDGKPYKTREGGVMELSTLINMAIDEVLMRLEARNIEKVDKFHIDSNEKVRVEDIATKVGVAAIKFADLINDRQSNYIFDIDKFCSFEGKTGPYILYSIVRIHSILRKFPNTETDNIKDYKIILSPEIKAQDLNIKDNFERDLMLTVHNFPNIIDMSYQKRTPHILCEFLFEIAQKFNKFYMNCPITGCDDKKIQESRLKLSLLAKNQMELICQIIGIETVDRM